MRNIPPNWFQKVFSVPLEGEVTRISTAKDVACLEVKASDSSIHYCAITGDSPFKQGDPVSLRVSTVSVLASAPILLGEGYRQRSPTKWNPPPVRNYFRVLEIR